MKQNQKFSKFLQPLYIPSRPDRCVCVYGEGLRAHEFRMRRAHFAFHFTVLTTSRSFFSGNYIDYFSISRINEPRCSSSPLWSPLHPGDITLLTYTHRTPPLLRFCFFCLSMPHGNDSLINPISSGCSPTQWRRQWRQVTKDALDLWCRFLPVECCVY